MLSAYCAIGIYMAISHNYMIIHTFINWRRDGCKPSISTTTEQRRTNLVKRLLDENHS